MIQANAKRAKKLIKVDDLHVGEHTTAGTNADTSGQGLCENKVRLFSNWAAKIGDQNYQRKFYRFVRITSNDGECWLWLSSKTALGYGRGYVRGVGRFGAYRLSYELAHGKIADGLVIDHLCHNPSCVNPLHLEAVTHGENIRRQRKFKGSIPHPPYRGQTCAKGHPLTDDNIVPSWARRGARRCLTCSRISSWTNNRRIGGRLNRKKPLPYGEHPGDEHLHVSRRESL